MESIPLQKALDAINNVDADELIAAKARGLMRGYDARWIDAGWVTESTEEVFHLPIVNPETGASSRTFTHAGKYDGIILYDRRPYLLEHKTTSEDIEDPNSTYWRRLVIDAQVSGYMLANWQNGRKLEGTVYDVIKKPGIRPRKLTKQERAVIVSDGTYFDCPVPDYIRVAVSDGDERECPRLFELRLSRDCISEPLKYFQRRPVPRLDADLLEFAGELWDVGQSIIEARRHDRNYRNPAACVQFNTPCEYLGICSGHDSTDSDKWQTVNRVHEELDLETDGRSVLTNSRVRCFQTCRRKHQLRYELGIRRVDEDDREPVLFGTLLHTALDAWWSCFREEQGHGDDNAASEAARSET